MTIDYIQVLYCYNGKFEDVYFFEDELEKEKS